MMTEARMKREEMQELGNKIWNSLAWMSGKYDVSLRGECDLESGVNRIVMYITLPQVEEEREEDEN